MEFSGGTEVLRFDEFTATGVAPGGLDEARRRFMTLFVRPDEGRRGGVGTVYRCANAMGETFALKTLNRLVSDEKAPSQEYTRRVSDTQMRLFREEYRTQLALSRLKGFPRLFGWGVAGDEPIIVMEWVEGVTVGDARRDMPHDATGNLGAEVCAQLGVAVLDTLSGVRSLQTGVAHRDISPGNIMIRTRERTLARQCDEGAFDICLIDFGSASFLEGDAPAFTALNNIWRRATPEYAPPEMLTNDLPGIAAMRHSPLIDTYALCGVLYELYSGQTPYRLAVRLSESPYLLKQQLPPRPAVHRPGDAAFVDALMAGLAPSQGKRAGIDELRAAFAAAAGVTTSSEQGMRAALRDDGADGYEQVELHALGSSGSDDDARIADVATGGADVEQAPGSTNPVKPVRDRRRLWAVVGAVAAAVVALCVALYAIVGQLGAAGPPVRGSFSEYSWDEVVQIADMIGAAPDEAAAVDIARRYHLVSEGGRLIDTTGYQKDITLDDGTRAGVRIIGIRAEQDAPAARTDHVGLTLMMTDAVGQAQMNADATNYGGWAQSAARRDACEAVFENLPDDLSSHIVEVSKPTNNTGRFEDPDSTRTDDRVWLCSTTELTGMRASGDQSEKSDIEGAQYQLFAEDGIVVGYSNTLLAGFADGTAGVWTRSPYPDSSTEFACIEPDGTPGTNMAANKRLAIVPAFCL